MAIRIRIALASVGSAVVSAPDTVAICGSVRIAASSVAQPDRIDAHSTVAILGYHFDFMGLLSYLRSVIFDLAGPHSSPRVWQICNVALIKADHGWTVAGIVDGDVDLDQHPGSLVSTV
ncbi:MAG: hypothetical protein ACREVH_08645 [Gammaproteobacteria bacterium]